MAELVLVQDRTISGKGLLRIPSASKKNRYYILYADVIRKPKNQYVNLNYDPKKSQYAYLNFMRTEYVIDSVLIQYERQVFDGINDITGQTLIAVKCAYQGILDSFVNLAVALAGTPGGIGLTYEGQANLISAYESLQTSWDEIRVICYADTALQLRLYCMEYDVCEPGFTQTFPPPPPEPPVPPVPPGTPIEDLSPPYEDDEFTQPYPEDDNPVPPPPTTGTACVAKSYDLFWRYVGSGGSPNDGSGAVWGKYASTARFINTGTSKEIQIYCQGIFPFQTCGAPGWYGVVVADVNGADLEIVSFSI